MKYLVREFNIFTNINLAIHEFGSQDEALDWACKMNEAMDATPIRYKFCNAEEKIRKALAYVERHSNSEGRQTAMNDAANFFADCYEDYLLIYDALGGVYNGI